MMNKEFKRKWRAFAKEMAEGFKLGLEVMPTYAPGMPTPDYFNYGLDPYLYKREREKAAALREKEIARLYEAKKENLCEEDAVYCEKKAS